MPITGGYRAKLYGQSEGLVCCALVTISHPDEGIVRFSTDSTTRISRDPLMYATLSRGEIYYFAPIEIILPLDEADSEPTAKLSISNLDRKLVPLTRRVLGDISVKIEIIDPEDPDVVQREFGDLEVVSASYDVNEIVFGLRVDIRQTEPFPAGRFTPSGFPGLF